jgi:iron(III) transport system permease protein
MNRAMNAFPVDFGLAAAYGSPLLILGVILIAAQRWTLRDSTKFEMLGAKGRRSAKRKMKAWQLGLFFMYIGVTVILPLAALIVVSVSPFWSGNIPTHDLTLGNYRNVFTDSSAIGSIVTTMKSVAITLLVVIPIGYLSAAILSSSTLRLARTGKALDVLVNIPLAMPAIIFGVGILFAYTEGPVQLYGTVAILVVAYITIMIPHVTRMQLSGMAALGERLTDASRSSGAGMLRTHWTIVIPLMRPSIAGATGLAVALLTHEFAASITVRGPGVQVMGTKLYDYYDLGRLPEVAVMAVTMVVVTGFSIAAALILGGRRAFDQ